MPRAATRRRFLHLSGAAASTVLLAHGAVARTSDGAPVDLGDKRLFHVSTGEGTPLIALHGGLGLDHAYLRPALDAWGRFAEVHYHDHEGNGRSSAPDDYGAVTLESMADDAVAMADALGLGRFVLFGHSYGGFVAQIAALRHPDRVRGLILSNTTARLGYDVVFPEWAPADARAAVGRLFSEPMESDALWAETWRAALPAYWRDPDPALMEEVHAATRYRAAALRRSLGLLEGFDVLERLAELDMPVLVLAGRDDFVTPAVASQDMHGRLPRSRLVVFEDSGHFPFFTEGARYTETVEDWIAQL
jgi:proline iminopeptidase